MAPGRGLRLTRRDLELLEFVAEHRLVLPGHAQARMRTSARVAHDRLRALVSAGLLVSDRIFHRQPACYRITARGLGAVGRSYPPPRLDLGTYDHDVGAAWLFLAAGNGTFGPMRDVVSERMLRSHDRRPDRTDPPFGVRAGGAGAPGLHYPDLLLITPKGQRIAIELELTPKGRGRREKILSAYAADARIDAVVYLVDRPELGEGIRASARRIGFSSRVHVQPVVWAQSPPRAAGRAVERAASRRPREAGR
jgi:hypothetical protein